MSGAKGLTITDRVRIVLQLSGSETPNGWLVSVQNAGKSATGRTYIEARRAAVVSALRALADDIEKGAALNG